MNNTVAAILRLRFIHYCVSVNNLQWENSFDYECRISAQLWMFDWEDSFNYRQRTVNSVRQEETSANYASLNNNPDIACSLHSPYHIIWWRWWVVRWCGHRRVHFLELRRDRRRAFTGFYWQTLRSVSDVWFAGEQHSSSIQATGLHSRPVVTQFDRFLKHVDRWVPSLPPLNLATCSTTVHSLMQSNQVDPSQGCQSTNHVT